VYTCCDSINVGNICHTTCVTLYYLRGKQLAISRFVCKFVGCEPVSRKLRLGERC